MTVFDGEPRCPIDTCYLYPNEDVVFGILKASRFSICRFLREGLGVRLKIQYNMVDLSRCNQCNKIELSRKYQYTKIEFSKKRQYSKREASEKSKCSKIELSKKNQCSKIELSRKYR
jgi:hypothetical protein